MQSFEQRRAERVLIRTGITFLPPQPFGRHVLQCSGPPPRGLLIAIVDGEILRNAEVGDARATIFPDQDVRWLEVAEIAEALAR